MLREYIIYEAPIRKKWAKDFKLVGYKIVPVYDEEIVQEKGYFYNNFFKKNINIDHGYALPDEREIDDLIDFTISRNQVLLYKLLQDPTIPTQVKDEYLEKIKRATSYLYFVRKDLKQVLVCDKASINNYKNQIAQENDNVQMTKRK